MPWAGVTVLCLSRLAGSLSHQSDTEASSAFVFVLPVVLVRSVRIVVSCLATTTL